MDNQCSTTSSHCQLHGAICSSKQPSKTTTTFPIMFHSNGYFADPLGICHQLPLHGPLHIGQCLLITVHQIQVDYNFICQPSPTSFHYPLHWDNTITAPATSSNVQWFDDHLHLFKPKPWCPISDLNYTPTTTAYWQQKTSRTLSDFQCSMQFTSSHHLPRWLCLFTTALC